jgi:hypothetical protein
VKTYTSMLLAAFVIAAIAAAPVLAQQKPSDTGKPPEQPAPRAEAAPPAAPAPPSRIVPLQIDLVIARYTGEKGDKKVSSAPYSLSVNATEGPSQLRPVTRLRMGGRVPISTFAPPTDQNGKPVGPVAGGGPVQYQDVGTNIDYRAGILPDGQFDVSITIEENSLAPNTQSGGVQGIPTLPVIRSMTAANNLVLRDGQTRQFTAAADRVTGEVVKVEVTLRVVK